MAHGHLPGPLGAGVQPVEGRLEKAIGASCERGQKGNAIKAALAYLDTDLGAITRTEFDVVRLVKGDTNDA